MSSKTAIIVPVYNEGKRAVDTIGTILNAFDGQIIVIDDGSSDNSFELLERQYEHNKRVIILQHIMNLGKGSAMKTGVKMAWKADCDTVVFIDADGQHNPEHLPNFIKAFENNDIVFGYRELKKDSPWIRRNGNIFAGWMISFLFNVKRKDLLCGFFGFKKSVYKKIKWKSCRYGIETEIATKVGRNKLSFSEVKIDTIYIDEYKGVSIFDAFKILLNIPYWYFSK